MDYRIAIFVLSLFVNNAYDCRTPQGMLSQCLSLYDCTPLLNAFNKRPLESDVITYLRKSQCGFEGYTPRVCCGPMPTRQDVSTTRRSVTSENPISSEVEQNNQEDSYPARQGQCGIDTSGDRIYGGQITELDEFPWMALLGYRKRDGRITYQCGGALINHRYVLTAAHCITGAVETEVGTLVTVRLGEYDTQNDIDCSEGVCADPPQNIPVHRTFPHSGYDDRNKNKKDDIGIIRLARRATYNYYVQPICLPDASTRINTGFDVYVAGWGKTLKGTNSPVKLKLLLSVFNKNECTAKYRNLGANLIDRQVCAGGALAQDACRGDSGGPLMLKKPEGRWVSVGVVSFGYGCGRDGWPGVYTSVSSYSDWIQGVVSSSNA